MGKTSVFLGARLIERIDQDRGGLNRGLYLKSLVLGPIKPSKRTGQAVPIDAETLAEIDEHRGALSRQKYLETVVFGCVVSPGRGRPKVSGAEAAPRAWNRTPGGFEPEPAGGDR